MLTKGAIGNLVNKYRAVLKKCGLLNIFGSLALAGALTVGAAGMAEVSPMTRRGISRPVQAMMPPPAEPLIRLSSPKPTAQSRAPAQ